MGETIEQVRAQAIEMQRKLTDMEEEERDRIQRPILRKLVGRCFRFTNSYGSGERWPLYAKILSFDEKAMTFLATNFEHTTARRVEIEYRREYNFQGRSKFGVDSNWQPISTAEYNRAKKKMLRFVAELLGS